MCNFRADLLFFEIKIDFQMENYPEKVLAAMVAEVKRHLHEGVVRIKKCLDQLSPEEIWFRPNENVVSVGNLVLHLCGNVRQWILTGLGGAADHRVRQDEFDERGPIPTEKLIRDLDELMVNLDATLDRLQPDDLLRIRSVQGLFEESGLSVLVHVTEHFSYHVGQITYFTKIRKDIDLDYYGGMDLTQTA